MSNIVVSQPGGVGTLTTDGIVRGGVRCYLSASGVTASAWTVLSKPSGSTATARLHPRLGWYFDPDVLNMIPYVIQMTDTVAGVHTNSFTALSGGAANLNEVFDIVKTFGASTSASAAVNTVAIASAIQAANAAGGGTVYVPEGDFNVIVPSGHGSSAVHLTGMSRVTIRGAGRYKSRLVDGGTQAAASELYPTEAGDPGGTAAFLTFQDSSDIHIEELGFVGKGVFIQANAGQTAVNKKAIYFKWTVAGGTTDCSVTDCYFTLIEGEAVFGDGWPNRLHVDRNHFVRCLSNQINYGSSSQAVNKSANCSADDNVIESPGASSFQGGGTNYSFSRNKISMLPADAAITTSNAILVVNSVSFLFEDNVFDGLIYAGGSPIVHFGYQGDDDGNIGARIRGNTFQNCKILGSAVDPSTAIITLDSTYGPQAYVVENNKFIGCAEQNHASYPNVVAIRLMGTFAHSGVIGPNEVYANGATNPLNTGIVTNVGVPGGNTVVIRPHVFDASVATPYTFNVAPSVAPQTYTVTNPTTDRALNVTADTLAQGLAVLGTLIADLQAQRIIR